MTPLTPKQQRVLGFIQETIQDTRFAPTRAEIAQAFGFRSANAAEEHLKALAKKGLIELTPGIARGIRLKEAPGLPVIGRVAAGFPVLAEEHILRRYDLDPNLFKPRADYLLTVRGMSMRDAGILEGDLLAVHKTENARSGQIVIARLHDEVTVKRLKHVGNTIELHPENPSMKLIKLNPKKDTLVIEGIAVGVIRNGRVL
jgi:repressor LexA